MIILYLFYCAMSGYLLASLTHSFPPLIILLVFNAALGYYLDKWSVL